MGRLSGQQFAWLVPVALKCPVLSCEQRWDRHVKHCAHLPRTHTPACRRLLPALLHFGESGSGGGAAGRAEALKYVRFAMQRLGSEDPAVHNLAVALLSQDADQASVLGWVVWTL